MRILDVVNDDPNGTATDEICRKLNANPQQLGDEFEQLLNEGKLLGFAGIWVTPTGYDEVRKRLVEALGKGGIDVTKALVKAQLTWKGKPLDRLLSSLREEGALGKVRLSAGGAELRPKQRKLLNRVIEVLERTPIEVPPPSAIALELVMPKQAVEEILRIGVQSGDIIQVDEAIFYTPKQLELIRNRTRSGRSAAAIRDILKTKRRYSEPILRFFRGDD